MKCNLRRRLARLRVLHSISLLACFTAACGGTTSADGVVEEHQSAGFGAFHYGQHYPQGDAAVSYIYDPAAGMWASMNPITYHWNLYPASNTTSHPTDPGSLHAAAQGAPYTAGDANCHLLLDYNHDGEIDTTSGGFAFFEHHDRGVGGVWRGGKPFSVFWFDDNWLARYMSQAYGQPSPDGLSDYSNFTRWRIVGGDAHAWTPYNQQAPDQLALDGLYYLAIGDLGAAELRWRALLLRSLATYDNTNQRFDYHGISENYHLGLFKILTDFLLYNPRALADLGGQLIDHSMSLRSHILSNQELDAKGTPLGWRTGIDDKGASLINTETIAADVLALGADAQWTFEAGRPPLSSAASYFLRPYFVLSAVTGSSQPGYMTYGPYWSLPVGQHWADFFLRAPASKGKVAHLDVRDATTGQILAQRDAQSGDFASGSWSLFSLSFAPPSATDTLELRVWWTGSSNLDVGSIRVR